MVKTGKYNLSESDTLKLSFCIKPFRAFYFRKSRSGFTLVELLVVIVIIGILSGFVAVGAGSFLKGARDSRRKDEINTVRKAIWMQSSMGSKGYPVESTWCCLGKTGDCPTLSSALVPSYLSALPSDPSAVSGNREYCYMYKSNGSTFDLYTRLEGKGAVSLSPESIKISTSQDCSSLPGGTWIDTGLGFCVMQYEARNASGYPVSQTGGTIWVSVTQNQAIAACKSIGAHLMNNAEWMAIARDVESVPSNYVNGMLKRGNAELDDDGTYSLGALDTGISNSKAQLVLSNGQSIWHFSGNAWEWVDYSVTTADAPPYAEAWREISSISNWGTNLGYENVGPKNTSLTSANGSGMIYTDNDSASPSGNIHAFLRGGSHSSGPYAGVFSLLLKYDNASTTSGGLGFRCAR